jgi:hypothetical protein
MVFNIAKSGKRKKGGCNFRLGDETRGLQNPIDLLVGECNMYILIRKNWLFAQCG